VQVLALRAEHDELGGTRASACLGANVPGHGCVFTVELPLSP
jgi:hypothetical protein